MSAEDKLLEEGYEDVVFFTDHSYDDALIGVDTNNRAVYDFNKMVRWLVEKEDFENDLEAVEWIEYNTIRSFALYWRRSANYYVFIS